MKATTEYHLMPGTSPEELEEIAAERYREEVTIPAVQIAARSDTIAGAEVVGARAATKYVHLTLDGGGTLRYEKDEEVTVMRARRTPAAQEARTVLRLIDRIVQARREAAQLRQEAADALMKRGARAFGARYLEGFAVDEMTNDLWIELGDHLVRREEPGVDNDVPILEVAERHLAATLDRLMRRNRYGFSRSTNAMANLMEALEAGADANFAHSLAQFLGVSLSLIQDTAEEHPIGI